MVLFILMDNTTPLNKNEVRQFVYEEIALHYTTYADFEKWAETYKGPFKEYLIKVRDYFNKKNNGRSGRIYPPLSTHDLEDIFNEVTLLKSP